MTGPQGKQFLSHKNYSKITRNLCISTFMIFACCHIIILYFRQVHRHRFFFSCFVAFAIHTENPKNQDCRNLLYKGHSNVQKGLYHLKLIPEGFKKLSCFKNICGHQYFSPWIMFRWCVLLWDIMTRQTANGFLTFICCPTLNLSTRMMKLKELSHEIETGCRWYEWIDLYLKRCRWQFINFLIAPSIFNSN
jgi:hypothetical protein